MNEEEEEEEVLESGEGECDAQDQEHITCETML